MVGSITIVTNHNRSLLQKFHDFIHIVELLVPNMHIRNRRRANQFGGREESVQMFS